MCRSVNENFEIRVTLQGTRVQDFCPLRTPRVKPAISLLEPIETLIFPLNLSSENGGVHGHPAFVFYMLYVTTEFRHALLGETVNDTIFLDSSNAQCKKLAHAHFPMHEKGGAGISACV